MGVLQNLKIKDLNQQWWVDYPQDTMAVRLSDISQREANSLLKKLGLRAYESHYHALQLRAQISDSDWKNALNEMRGIA